MVVGAVGLRANNHNLFKAQDWLVQDKSAQLEILNQSYAHIPDSIKDDKQRSLYLIGEALFRTPTLLGGQAAKARISCNSCHINGTDNPYFLFPNISGEPGTADVSNSFFSSFRGNQNFDPVKIPDLRKVGKISHDLGTQELRIFIRGLIVEEFNGHEPSDSTLNALTFYVRNVKNTDMNQSNKRQSLSVKDPLKIINQATENIKLSLNNDDLEIANLLTASVRNQLGLIHERYNNPKHKYIRTHIIKSSNSLALIKNNWSHDNPKHDSFSAIDIWEKEFTHLSAKLYQQEKYSLYNIKKLRQALSANTK